MDDGSKPSLSYKDLISLAFTSSPTGILNVGQIYDFVSGEFSYFKNCSEDWRKNIRKELSRTKCFQRVSIGGKVTANDHLWQLNRISSKSGKFKTSRMVFM